MNNEDEELKKEDGTHTSESEAEETKAPAEDNEKVAPEPEPEKEAVTQPEKAPVQAEKTTPVQAERTFTQSQVNEIVGRARAEGRASALKEMLGRYGVDSEDSLNNIFGNGQKYELLNDDYHGLETRYGDAMTENALLKSRIVPGRWEDVKAILTSKGMDITPENISLEMETHPEWKGEDDVVQAPVINKIDKFGDDTLEPVDEENEHQKAMRLLGFKEF